MPEANEIIRSLLDFTAKYFPEYLQETPKNLPLEITRMRLNFLLEELVELAEACDFSFNGKSFVETSTCPAKANPEEILDALVDIVYVAIGTAVYLGFISDKDKLSNFSKAFRRIQAANMRKIRVLSEDQSKRGTKVDVIKPPDWKHPALSDLTIGFFGKCRDCECDLTNFMGHEGSGKCAACNQ